MYSRLSAWAAGWYKPTMGTWNKNVAQQTTACNSSTRHADTSTSEADPSGCEADHFASDENGDDGEDDDEGEDEKGDE